MFKNYLKIAWRNIVRHKGYSFINIFGLAVGLASCIMILLWVQDEMSYDRFHKNAGAIHRVIVQATEPGGGSESICRNAAKSGTGLESRISRNPASGAPSLCRSADRG